MADEATTPEVIAPSDAAVETSDDSTTEPAAPANDAATEEVDWRAKFEAQQKVTRDLERKVKGEAGSLKAQLAELQAKIDGREAEFAAEREAQRVKDDALAVANERIVGAELRAAAKGKVADDVLTDLALFIKPSDFEVGDDGSVDSDAIAQAVDNLIKNKPSLAAQGSRFQGSADGGARNDATKAAQLSADDMRRMTPEQIDEAERNGQFDRLLGRT